MLIPYQALMTLPSETLDNLIKEYLLTQVEDGGFANSDAQMMASAISQCKNALKSGELLVEFSEDDESFTLRRAQELNI